MAQKEQSHSKTLDLRKGLSVMQLPSPKENPSRDREYFGFHKGGLADLSYAQLAQNKLLARKFDNLAESSVFHTYLNVSFLIVGGLSLSHLDIQGQVDIPFGDPCFVEFICDLLGGKKGVNPAEPRFCLHFFKNNVPIYVVEYAILVVR